MPSLSIRVCFADSKWSWYLADHDEIDVYAGAAFVTTLRAAILRQMVGHYLAQARLTATVLEGARAPRKALQSAPRRTALPRAGVPAQAIQEARRAKRAGRLGRPRQRTPA